MPRTPEVCPSAFCPLTEHANRNLLHRRRPRWRVPPVALCLLLLFINVNAQTSTGTLSGTVTDQNGDLIPGASVAVIGIAQALQRNTMTNGEGVFIVPLLPPGTYTIKVERQGFTPHEVRDVVLNVNSQVTLRIALAVGEVGQTVSVVDSPPLINESPTVGTVVGREFVENLPLNGRSFQALISLTPGVVTTKTNYNEQGQFSVNGQRADGNYFTVDGVSANAGVAAGLPLVQSGGGALPAFSAAGGTNSLVSVDAMQEFRIQTSTFAPEFGRTPGAQISIATRSGGNDFHGTLFDYFRNDVLDANDWFANSRRLPKAALRQNDFGGVLGGPLHLPRFGEGGPAYYDGRNRTFFFFSYEGVRLRQPATQLTFVPSLASRQAASATRRPYLDAYPLPNGALAANGFAEFAASYSDPLDLDATSIRVDHSFNENLALFVRYNHSPSETTQRGTSARSLNTLSHSFFKTQTLTLGLTHSITPHLINEFRANYTRTEGANEFTLDNLGGAIPLPTSLAFPPFASPADGLFSFSIGQGGRTYTLGNNVVNIQRQINLVDNVSVVTGGHQLKFGVDYRLLLPVGGPHAYDQLITFSGLTGATGAISGNTQAATINSRDAVALSFINFSLYGQDTWKATDRLTFTYGLRWDVNPAPQGRHGKDLLTFDNVNGPGALAVAPAGTPLYETTYNNFAPRFGLTYQLFRDGGRLTILRGGVGIFYDLGTGLISNATAGFPYNRAKALGSVPFPLTLTQAAPPPFTTNVPTAGFALIADRELKLPRVYQWNAAVEQSLNASNTFSASYIGAVGRRLLYRISKQFPASFLLSINNNSGNSDYHGMQLQFQRRMSRGLQILTSYTWSHSIDSGSTDSGVGSSPNDPNRDRGNSDFDVRHAFSAAVTYGLPSPRDSKFAKAIFGNWFVDGVVSARSAVPVDLFTAGAFIGGVQTIVRPDIIPGIPLYLDDPLAPGGFRFNNTINPSRPTCKGPFCPAPAGRQGTFGRNVLRGFPMSQFDIAVRRRFSLGERVGLQLRAEAFNIFNHPNFGDPGTNNDLGNFLPSPNFGVSTQMLRSSLGTGGTTGGFSPLYQVGGPRSIQLALKLEF